MREFETRIFDQSVTDKPETIAGAEVIGVLPSKLTIEKDGKKTVERGSISVVYDPSIQNDEASLDGHEE